jgi:hypothetical protein
LSKKRQIPQIDGCFSPPSPPLPPSPSTPHQPVIEFEDQSPPHSEESFLALQAPAPPQALSPRRAPSPLVLAPAPATGKRSPSPTCPPAPSAAQPANTAPAATALASRSAPRPGYTLVLIWCPTCKKSLIDNRDYECYMCQERRYYLSLEYEEE